VGGRRGDVAEERGEGMFGYRGVRGEIGGGTGEKGGGPAVSDEILRGNIGAQSGRSASRVSKLRGRREDVAGGS
jgi:hypothetical protein